MAVNGGGSVGECGRLSKSTAHCNTEHLLTYLLTYLHIHTCKWNEEIWLL